MFNSRNSSLGVTLLELMLVMSMSLLLISSAFVIYLAMQKNHHLLTAINEIQENSRMASQLLREHVQIAGYRGCAYTQDSGARISGTDNTLTTYQASTQSANLIFAMSEASTLVVAAKPNFKVGDMAVISDCQAAEIFQIKKVMRLNNGAQKLFLLQPLNRMFSATAEVGRWQVFTYLVKKTGRVHKNGVAISALYARNTDNRLQEWVAGVDAMQVHYAVTNQNQLAIVSAAQVSDWMRVVGVQIKLLLSATKDDVLHKTAYVYIALREV
jgi:hypothetical protein